MLRKDAFGDVKTKTALCGIIPQGYALVKNLFLSFQCDSTAGILHDDMRIAALCGKRQCDGTVHLGEGQGIVQQIFKRTCQLLLIRKYRTRLLVEEIQEIDSCRITICLVEIMELLQELCQIKNMLILTFLIHGGEFLQNRHSFLQFSALAFQYF